MRRMTGIPGKNGLLALEDEELNPAETGAELGDAPESLETDLMEVNEEAGEAEAEQAEVEEAEGAAEALEAIAVSLESIAGNGGLDKNGAIMMQHAVQAQYDRVGLRARPAAALESFGGTSSRVGATTISLEDIRDQIKKIWDAIIANIKKAIEWVKERFLKIFGAAEKLEKRADALQKLAADTTGSAKEKSFDNERLVKALHVGNNVNAGEAAQHLASTAEVVFKNAASWNAEAADVMADMLEEDKPNLDFSFKAYDLPNLTDAGNAFGDAGEGMKYVRSAELPGGQAVIGRVNSAPLTGVEGIDKMSRISFSIGKYDPKGKEPSKATVNTLSIPDCEKVAKLVGEVAVELKGFRRKQEEISKAKARILKAAEQAGKNAEKAEGDEKKKYTALQKLGAAVPRVIDQPAVGFSAYALNSGKALLDYVELSLKQYSSDK